MALTSVNKAAVSSVGRKFSVRFVVGEEGRLTTKSTKNREKTRKFEHLKHLRPKGKNIHSRWVETRRCAPTHPKFSCLFSIFRAFRGNPSLLNPAKLHPQAPGP